MAWRRGDNRERRGSEAQLEDNIGGVLFEMMERMMLEAHRVQTQMLTAALRGTKLQMEQQLQERDDAFRALRQELDTRMRQIEHRLSTVEEKMILSEGRGGTATTGGQVSLEQLEQRMQVLEDSIQRALCQVFPRVEALVAQLEDNSSLGPPSVSASPSAPLTSSVTSSSSFSASARPRPPPVVSTHEAWAATREESARARNESPARHQSPATDGEREKQLIEQRMQEVRARRDRARAAPSSLGEDLCSAAFNKRLEEVDRLLESGADANYIDSSGDSPLVSALRCSDPNADVVALLLASGAVVNAVNVHGRTALHFAARADASGLCVTLLVSAGADVDARDANGATALHRAAANANEAAVRALIAAGARTSLRCWSGFWSNASPYDCARSLVVRQLLHS